MERVRVLVVSPGRMLDQAAGALPSAVSEWEHDPTRALALLLHGALDVGLVASDLGRGLSGADLVREATDRGCDVPLIVVGSSRADGAEEEAALEAGAVACIDLSRGRPQDLAWAVSFAHASRVARDARQGELVRGVSACLGDHARSILAAIDERVQALAGAMPAEHPDRGVCREIQTRLGAFAATLDAVDLAIRTRAPLTDARASFVSAARSSSPQPAAVRRMSTRAVRLVGRSAD